MMEPEPPKTRIRVHEKTKLRLRSLSNEFNIYSKFFKREIAFKISVLQLGIAIMVIISQIVTMSTMEHIRSNEIYGFGIVSSTVVGLSAGLTIWSCLKPTYARLHLAMAFSIVSLAAQFFLIVGCLGDGLPYLSTTLSEAVQENTKIEKYEEILKLQAKVYAEKRKVFRPFDEAEILTTPYSYRNPYHSGDNPQYPFQKDDLTIQPIELIVISVVFTSLMALGGILQTMLSLSLAVLTGRAICCGRSHMEGRFFEMEGVTGSKGHPIVQFRPANPPSKKCSNGGKELETKKSEFRDGREESMDSVTLSSPPSYDETSFFQHNEVFKQDHPEKIV